MSKKITIKEYLLAYIGLVVYYIVSIHDIVINKHDTKERPDDLMSPKTKK